MESLNQPAYVALAFYEAEGRAEPDFGNDVVCHVDGPGREVELRACVGEAESEFGEPVIYSMINQRFHFLHVAKCIRTRCYLPIMRMDFMFLHVKQTLLLAKTTRDVVVALVRLAVVNFGEFGGIRDKKESGRDAQYGAMLLVEVELDGAFIALDVVVCDPETGDGRPEGAWEVAEGMKEAVVDDLVEEGEGDVGEEEEEDV